MPLYYQFMAEIAYEHIQGALSDVQNLEKAGTIRTEPGRVFYDALRRRALNAGLPWRWGMTKALPPSPRRPVP